MAHQNSILTNALDLIIIIVISALSLIYTQVASLYTLLVYVFLVIVSYRRSIKMVSIHVLSVFCTTLIIGMIILKTPLIECIILFLNLSLLPIAVGFSFKYAKSYLNAICIASTSKVIIVLCDFLKLKFIDKIDLSATLIKQPILESVNAYLSAFPELNIETSDIIAMISSIAPAFLIISAIASALFMIMISKKIINIVYSDNVDNIGSFSNMKINRSVAIIMLISSIILFFAKQSLFFDALMNIVIVFFFIFFIYGFSFIDYFFKKTGLWGIVRIIIYFIAFIILSALSLFIGLLNPFFLLSMLGVSDCVASYRTRFKKV